MNRTRNFNRSNKNSNSEIGTFCSDNLLNFPGEKDRRHELQVIAENMMMLNKDRVAEGPGQTSRGAKNTARDILSETEQAINVLA